MLYHFPIRIGVVFLLLFCFILPAWGIPSSANPALTATATSLQPLPIAVDSSSDVIPLSVSVKKPLRDIQASYTVVESARQDQREKYSQLQKRLLDSSSSERPLLHAQLVQQRQRVLLSTLNSMIIIFQRADFVLNQFDETLLRLRSKYLSTKRNRTVADFDSRMRTLESTQSSLQKKSVDLSKKLSAASSSVTLSDDLFEIKTDLSSFIKEMTIFTSDYRSLAKEVISS